MEDGMTFDDFVDKYIIGEGEPKAFRGLEWLKDPDLDITKIRINLPPEARR